MSRNQLHTPTKSYMNGYAIRVTTSNPFAVLDTAVNSQSGSSSPSSAVGPVLQNGDTAGGAALATPTRGFVLSGPSSEQEHLSTNGIPPDQMRRMSVNASNAQLGYTSPAQPRMETTVDFSGSPLRVAAPGRTNINQQVNPNFGQASPSARRGSGRASFSSNLRAPTMMQDPYAASLTGIPQVLAVQEMAYRQGQQDHGISRERIPSSPFAKHFDQVWAHFYVLGKECGGTSNPSSNVGQSSAHQNFPWPVLINPYTQDLEHPNGAVDSEWVRKVCTISLNCMAALIGTVCRRQGEWRKTVCDVPAQVKQALLGFEDLRRRYERLQQDAREAVAGGLPAGY